jgi:hypothetical protein
MKIIVQTKVVVRVIATDHYPLVVIVERLQPSIVYTFYSFKSPQIFCPLSFESKQFYDTQSFIAFA